MKARFLKLKYVLLAVFIGLNGCAKDGEPGPQGPKGEQGPQGEQGVQGETGENGENGTANVFYSDWITPVFEYNTTGDFYSAKINTPKLTEEVSEKGLVVVYMSLGGFIRKLDYHAPPPLIIALT